MIIVVGLLAHLDVNKRNRLFGFAIMSSHSVHRLRDEFQN